MAVVAAGEKNPLFFLFFLSIIHSRRFLRGVKTPSLVPPAYLSQLFSFFYSAPFSSRLRQLFQVKYIVLFVFFIHVAVYCFLFLSWKVKFLDDYFIYFKGRGDDLVEAICAHTVI